MTTATLMTEQALTSTRQTGEWIESQHLITDTPSEVVVASASPAAELTSFLQYWADDVLGGPHARTILLNTPFSGEQFVGMLFMPITMLLFLPTCLLAGGASDRWGRKGLVYVSGAMMTIVCLISIFFQTQYGALIAAAFFGIGFGAYTSVDMALTTEVLPPTDEAGKFMGTCAKKWHPLSWGDDIKSAYSVIMILSTN
jgi:Major Facilitator Superfamily